MRQGTLAAAVAYILWGLLPIYWKAVSAVPALELLGHRIVWSLVVVLVLLLLRRNWQWLDQARARPAMLLPFVVTAALLAANWFTYIWATNNNHIVEASLGYFINPLLNVLLGLVFLRERLRPGQWLAVAIAAVGVSYLVFNIGGLLWVSFTLALTFGFYGLLRKIAPLGSLEGLTVEMSVLFLPALLLLFSLQQAGTGAFGHASPAFQLLLAMSGVITAAPLLCFAFAAKRVTMTTLGILQYIAPTLQFMLGVFVYGEVFPPERLVGFAIIWTALLVYSVESLQNRRRRRGVLMAN
ncbi:MAG: EamA family transporter RarD [Chloroflexota bacterium]|nr:EamA family transporter RarD [Chloroflexota bacterium]